MPFQIFSTNDCELAEPIYGEKFNFKALHSDIAKVVKGGKDDTFEYNICGSLSRACNGVNNASACLRRGNQEYVLGK